MMIESLSSPVANGLKWTLFHFLWQGLLIGLGYWALLAATDIRKARVRYAISLFALGVMALCPLVTFAEVYDTKAAVNETSAAVATSTSFLAEMAAGPLKPQVAGTPAADRQTLSVLGVSGFAPAQNTAIAQERDGKLTPTEFIYWYTKGRFENVREGGPRGLQDGERGQRGARDGSVNKGPRDG